MAAFAAEPNYRKSLSTPIHHHPTNPCNSPSARIAQGATALSHCCHLEHPWCPMSSKAAVTVCCRIRPRVNRADASSGQDAFVQLDNTVHAKERGTSFNFDSVFGPDATQEGIFNAVAQPLIDAVLSGINATVMCYGQVSRAGRCTACCGEAHHGARSLLILSDYIHRLCTLRPICRLAPAKHIQ